MSEPNNTFSTYLLQILILMIYILHVMVLMVVLCSRRELVFGVSIFGVLSFVCKHDPEHSDRNFLGFVMKM